MHSKILIIGAGLSGLMAAHALADTGQSVRVVDKGRSVGGRLATRRVADGRADHGAQFFSVRSQTFQAHVDRWLDLDLAYVWSHGWSDGSLFAPDGRGEGYPRYAIRGGMNALAKHLAQGLDDMANREIDMLVDAKVQHIQQAGKGWHIATEDGRVFTADRLIVTSPVPQSLAMVDAGETVLHPEDRAALERIVYAPCVAGLFHVDGDVDLPEPGALQRPDTPISWVADNQRKGISPAARIVTVHASPALSRSLWDTDADAALAHLEAEGLRPHLADGARLISGQLKKWRYALPEVIHPEKCLVAQELPPLVFAGDAFGGPRVEGAALSGLAAGGVSG